MCQALQGLLQDSRRQGEKKGEYSTIFNFIKKGRMTIEEAASDIGISVEQLLTGFKEFNLILEE